MDTLEAGTAPLVGHEGLDPEIAGNREARGAVLRKSLSWLDQGLGIVDGADGFLGRMARWMDDDGGHEPLLLPVANEKMFKVD